MNPRVFSVSLNGRGCRSSGGTEGRKFYNEAGSLIYQDGDGNMGSKIYVIRTSKTLEDFDPNYDGKINGITPDEAKTTEEKIGSGVLVGDHMKNIILLETSENLNQMFEIVSQDDGLGGTGSNNNREYGGIKENGVIKEIEPGSIGDPSRDNVLGISSTKNIYFHSHPSGTIEITDYAAGLIYVKSWAQPPSNNDINRAVNGKEIVFAMREKMIYVYTQNGIQATIPFSAFNKK